MRSRLRNSSSERTLKLTLAYDGSRFSGWQRQPNSRSIQQLLEEALHQLFRKKITVVGAGRTDSGVHAEGQTAHAAVPNGLSTRTIHRALNAILPEDLAVLSVRRAEKDFHAIGSAKWKHYRYTIWNRPVRPVLERQRLLHVPLTLDLAAMRRAARALQGRHDFRNFHSSGREVPSTIRTLKRLSLKEKNGRIEIDAVADGFLYHMVRRMVGTLINVGSGKHPPEIAQQLLRKRGTVIAPTAPAKGLCLIRVYYS